MSHYPVFAAYLAQRLNAKSATISDLSKELGYRTSLTLSRWFEGKALPSADDLFPLAMSLGADPVVLGVGWLIAQAPDLADIMDEEVLAHRQEKLPGFD